MLRVAPRLFRKAAAEEQKALRRLVLSKVLAAHLLLPVEKMVFSENPFRRSPPRVHTGIVVDGRRRSRVVVQLNLGSGRHGNAVRNAAQHRGIAISYLGIKGSRGSHEVRFSRYHVRGGARDKRSHADHRGFQRIQFS